jgi:hypothetical protein
MTCSRSAARWIGAACAAGLSLLTACSAPAVRSNQRPPHVAPVAFRVHTVLFDMPVARLRELLPQVGTAEPLMRAVIDENDTRKRLLDLARSDASIAVTARDDVVLEPGSSGHVPAGTSRAASDALDIEVKVMPPVAWEACTLGFAISRRDSSSEKHVADTPMPADYWLEVDIVSAAENLRGIIVFLQPEIVWPETGDL